MWTDFSVRPVLPIQYVRTRWQSKYGMLKSLVANKGSVRRMCASDDECCSALHDQDLSDAEWQIIEVRLFLFCFVLLQWLNALVVWAGVIAHFPTLG